VNRRLRIGLLATIGHEFMGGVEYIKNIASTLASLPPQVRSTFEICLIHSQVSADLYREVHPQVDDVYYLDAAVSTIPGRVRLIIAYILSTNYSPQLDNLLKKAKIDFAFPCSAGRIPTPSYRSAAWVYDCQHKYLTQFFSEQEMRARDREFQAIAKYASVVAFNSRNTEADFNMFFPNGKYEARILYPRVCPLPEWYEVDPINTQQHYHLPDRFFFINNQFWQHKNHRVVFEALKILREQGIEPVVVCTGRMYDYRSPRFLDETLQTINRLGIAHQVYLLGIVPRLEMISLLRRSIAIVHPSLFEGWSTVVEEARCLGKTIILSDIPIHREQDPPYGVFFDQNSAERLSSVLAEYWRNLKPGPDTAREATARKANLEEVQAYGYRFLDMAKG